VDKDLKGDILAYFKAVSRYTTGETDENHENLV
jgi:hypothetical protein